MAKSEKLQVPVQDKPAPKTETASRPPVVAVLGHVDHGKTTLLDFIRQTHVAEKEAGSITQHIGAYQVEQKGRKITFLDTPGHEAFSAMRARGGAVSDLAVLVIAADDGVMPQTREAIAHIKAAGIPFIIAINKMDIPGVHVDRVKKQLSEEEVLVEGYGGDVVVVPICAKTGKGVDDLLEMINLVADLQNLQDTSRQPFKGVVIEAKLDKSKGPTATVLVKEGILRTGEPIYTQTAEGKTKALVDVAGSRQKEVYPSTPVEVLGFTSVPKVGEAATNQLNTKAKVEEEKPTRLDIKEKLEKLNENEIRMIIKADVGGSLEAITGALEKLKSATSKVKIYYADTGNITESDVLLAAATRSLLIGFNVSITSSASRIASEEKVLIRTYNVIYELINELKEGLEALSVQKQEEEVLGEAEVLDIFKIGENKIAGCTTRTGRINADDTIKVMREGREIGRSKVASMKHKETVIKQAKENEEFGLVLEKKVPFTKGDIIISIGRSVTN